MPVQKKSGNLLKEPRILDIFVSTRIVDFYIILINYFSEGVIIFKMFAYFTKQIFSNIDIFTSRLGL